MWQRSSALSLIYVLIGAVVVFAYINSPILSMLTQQMHLPADLSDLLFTGVLIAVGAVLVIMGADVAPVVITGTIGSFVCLTLNQEPLVRYLTLAAVLFCIGMYGMIVSRNAVRVLMSIELMLNAVNINLVAFSRYVDPDLVRGQLFAVFILCVAAAEAAVGLAIVLSIYRNMSTVDMEKFNLLKW